MLTPITNQVLCFDLFPGSYGTETICSEHFYGPGISSSSQSNGYLSFFNTYIVPPIKERLSFKNSFNHACMCFMCMKLWFLTVAEPLEQRRWYNIIWSCAWALCFPGPVKTDWCGVRSLTLQFTPITNRLFGADSLLNGVCVGEAGSPVRLGSS